MLNILSVFAIFPAVILALPAPYSIFQRGDRKLIMRESTIWTTISGIQDGLDLNLESFRAKDMLTDAKPSFGEAPDGSPALEIHFNKGSYDLKGPKGGMSFYASPIDFSNAKEVTFRYSVFFSDNFNFNLGGKLPGLYGGDSPDTSISCSGGRRDITCWSTRYMFREKGAAELYTYLPQPSSGSQFSGNKQLCHVPPLSDCNSVYGASVARGSWMWKPGTWTTVSQRVKLNDGGQQNGEIEVTADGKTVINLKGLALGGSKNRFQGVMMQSFFGGHAPEWASPQDQDIYTKDYFLNITQTFD